ncbi:MAG: hypothetical protein EAX89_08235 [Candidatus Lokiarchaeota archaeon]|nr:hypothetical protein [Candidatus Lokiarchaeota archaeon]
MKNTSKGLEKQSESDLILDYYKDWNSESNPVMMMFDISDSYPGIIESEDEKKMAYLRMKYNKRSK